MARHDIPDDDSEHTLSPACPCGPTVTEDEGRRVVVHAGATDDETGGGEHDPQ